MSDLMMFTCSHAIDDPERATLPFVAANVAAAAGQDAVVVCTIDAVRLGTPGGSDAIVAAGHPPLSELIASFVDAGGRLWLCSACTKPRGIGEDDCIDGATIVGAAAVVEELAKGARSISFA